MRIGWNWALVIFGALLVLVEVAFGGFAGFDLVLIGSAFVVGGALGLAFNSVVLGFVVASALCIAYIVVGRRYVRARFANRPTSSNVDALLGRQGVVVQPIAPHSPGQVRVNDEIWRADVAPGTTDAFEPGSLVTVVAISGVTLQVRR